MKKSALWKDTFREITHSKSRFLSIFAIILLGVAFYAGISATGPDMLDTADTYFTNYRLMDHQVLSTMGLTEEDMEELENLPGVTVQPHYTQDVILDENGMAVKLFSYAGEDAQQLNQYEVMEGRLPEQSGEIALDDVAALREEYSLGDTFRLETEEVTNDPGENLETLEFEVVGFVSSPLYIETGPRGNTNIGSGTLSGFGVIPEEDFDMEVRTEAFLVFDQSNQQMSYSAEYEQSVDGQTDLIEESVAHRPEERRAEIQADIQEQIEEGEQELEDARQQIADAEEELASGRQELDDGWQAYEEGRAEFEQQIEEAREEIERQRQRLVNAQEELDRGRADIEAGRLEIANQRANLEEQKNQLRQAEAGLAQIETAEVQLEAGQQEINRQRNTLANARQQLDAAQEGVNQLNAAASQLDAAQV